MAENRKSFRSNRTIATLPYLTAPSDEEIDQLEIVFHLETELAKTKFFDNEERFFDWLCDLEDAQFEHMNDMYRCLSLEKSWRKLTAFETTLLQDLHYGRATISYFLDLVYHIRPLTHEEQFLYGDCDPWSGTSNDPHLDDWGLDDIDFQRDDCQLFGYQDFNYWNPKEPDPLQDPEDSFCPEQVTLREIPLRGLKHQVRQQLIREYCVH
jgi:hypothetical protein